LGASLGIGVVSALAWLLLETSAIAEAPSLAETVAEAPSVLLGTRFGQVLGLQACATIVAGLLLAARRCGGAASFAGVAVLLEAGHSHAFAMGDYPLTLSQALHLIAAGAWLGGLLPLLVVVHHAPLAVAQRTLHRFSPLALFCVTVLAATAVLQGVELAGGFKGLVGTAYGAVLLTKAVLFAVLIALAANNRLRLTPALAGPQGERSKRALAFSVIIEIVLGLFVVFAASVLSSLEPGMHMAGT
jgi:putative copper export protein